MSFMALSLFYDTSSFNFYLIVVLFNMRVLLYMGNKQTEQKAAAAYSTLRFSSTVYTPLLPLYSQLQRNLKTIP